MTYREAMAEARAGKHVRRKAWVAAGSSMFIRWYGAPERGHAVWVRPTEEASPARNSDQHATDWEVVPA